MNSVEESMTRMVDPDIYKRRWAALMAKRNPNISRDVNFWVGEYDRQMAKPITHEDPNTAYGRGFRGREGFRRQG